MPLLLTFSSALAELLQLQQYPSPGYSFCALVLLWPLSHLPAAQGHWAKPTGSARTRELLARSCLLHHSTPLCRTALSHLSSWDFPELNTPALLGCVFPNSVFHCSISKAEFNLDSHYFNYRLWLLNSTTEQNIHIVRWESSSCHIFFIIWKYYFVFIFIYAMTLN